MNSIRPRAGKALIILTGFAFFAAFSPGFLAAQNAAIQVGASPIWAQDMGDLVSGQPYLQTESAVVACAGGSIKSYYMTGTALWSYEPNEAATPFIARSVEGTAYICNTSGVFRAINRIGRELWRVNLGRPVKYPPVVGWDGRVFIPVESEMVCRTAAGHPLWSIALGSPIAAAPILDHAGSLGVVLENRDFARISQFSAVERIRLAQTPLIIVSLKSGAEDSYVLFYPSGEAEKISYNENAPKGSRLSRSGFPSLPASPAAAASRGNRIAVTLRDGKVLLLDGDGRILWRGDSHESAAENGSAALNRDNSGMVFDERGIYSVSTRGATGFAEDGRRRFVFKIPEANSVPALSDEGLLYVCGKDKFIRAYKTDSKPRTVPRSKFYGPDPEGSYGMGNPPPSSWAGDSHRYDNYQQDIMFTRIERAINSGQLGEDEPIYTSYMMEMIGFFLNDPHYSRVRPTVTPPRRVAFIRLLGKIGSRETVPFLWNIFDRDAEPAIKAACAEAIGNIGVDPKGNTFYSYNFLLAANNPNRDPQLLMSATSSIAALCRFSGPPLSGEGILLLRYFSNLSWAPNSIKNQIRNEIDALYREGLDRVIN